MLDSITTALFYITGLTLNASVSSRSLQMQCDQDTPNSLSMESYFRKLVRHTLKLARTLT